MINYSIRLLEKTLQNEREEVRRISLDDEDLLPVYHERIDDLEEAIRILKGNDTNGH